jgi:Xaa-Pro aminopeptidase
MKAVKNAKELEGMKEAHILDGVAMAKFIAWCKKSLSDPEAPPVTETLIDEKLLEFRGEVSDQMLWGGRVGRKSGEEEWRGRVARKSGEEEWRGRISSRMGCAAILRRRPYSSPHKHHTLASLVAHPTNAPTPSATRFARRTQSPDFTEASFPTIAGVGSNGAIIHYRAHASSPLHKTLTPSTPILIDSGGQYTMGTTDVTRTWQFGEPTPVFSSHFTNVLKGNIGIDSCIFPENTPGVIIDSFARRALWNSGFDYGHGTGHGVGAALNVHEGPASISPRMGNKEPLKAGMVLSNEPGYYEPGNFGIRIENLLIVKEKIFDRKKVCLQ